MKKQLLIFALSLITYLAQSQVVPNIDWVKTFNPRFQRANAPSALDANNNVYVTGYISTSASNQDLIVLKYDSLGTLLWSYIYNNGGNDAGKAIKVSSTGNVYVTGQSYDAASNFDYYTIKLSPTGSVIWSARYDYLGSTDAAVDIKIDEPAAKVYVTGSGFNGSDNDIITLLYDDSNGSLVWNNVYDGGVSGNDDAVGLVIVDNGNFLMIAGNCINSSGNYDIAAINIKNDGSPNWSYYTDGTAGTNDNAKAIIATGANVAICGMVNNNSSNQDYATIVIDALTPSLIWQNNYDVSNGIQSATSLVNDSTGNIAVTGYAVNSGIYEYHTLLYSPTGTQLFTNVESTGINNLYIEPRVATDTIAHHFYVSGAKLNTNNDVFVYQIAPSGNTKWREYHNGSSNLGDAATGLVVNGIGVVYLSALSLNTSGNWDIITMKISQTPVYFPIDNLNETPLEKHLYYSNNGQIKNTSNNPEPSILAYTDRNSHMLYMKNNSFSLVKSKIDTISATTDTTSRVDFDFIKSNLLTKIYYFEPVSDNILNYYKNSSIVENVIGYKRALIPNLFNLIDLHYYSNQNGLKQYYVVKPTGNPQEIQFKINGANNVSLSGTNLVITTPLGNIIFDKPNIYQVNMNLTITTFTNTNWVLNSNIASFSPVSYNPALPLIIEIDNGNGVAPGSFSSIQNLDWSTFYGGSDYDSFTKCKNDNIGNLYVAGNSQSSNFPVLGTNVQAYSGQGDVVLAKFNKNGVRKWATYYGGTSGENFGVMEIDSASNKIYLAGRVGGNINYPSSQPSGAFVDNTFNGNQDIFITQFDSLGALKWATLYGGPNIEDAYDIKLDKNKNLYIVGYHNLSAGFPLVNKPGAYNSSTGRGYILKFTPNLQINWCTNFGYTLGGEMRTINFDSQNNVIVSGNVYDSIPIFNFSGAYNDPSYNGSSSDGFMAGFNANTNNIFWSTYLGGASSDQVISSCQQKAVNSGSKGQNSVVDNLYFMVGSNSANFPKIHTSSQFFDSIMPNNLGTKIVKLDLNTKNIIWSTGFRYIGGVSCVVDDQSKLLVAGTSNFGQSIFKKYANYYFDTIMATSTSNTLYDCHLAIFSPNDTLIHSTYIGGSNDDAFLNVSYSNGYLYYCGNSNSGQTASTSWPLVNLGGTPPAWWQPTVTNNASGLQDATVGRFNLYNSPVGIEENTFKRNDNLFIYPNPSSEYINFENKIINNSKSNIEIYNSIGQLVLSVNDFKNPINVQALPQGFYVVKITSDNYKFSSKFLKN